MSFLRSLFSFRGRTGRLFYWLFYLVHAGIYGTAALTFYSVAKIYAVRDPRPYDYLLLPGFVVGTVLIFIPAAAVVTRRLHDRGRSGWWLLLGVGLAFLAFATVLKFAPYLGYLWLDTRAFVESLTALGVSAMLGFVPWSAGVFYYSRGDAEYNYLLPALLGVGPLLIFGLWFLIDAGLRRGVTGANAYGPEPAGWLGSGGGARTDVRATPWLPISGAALAAITGIVLLSGVLERHTMPCDITQTITPAAQSNAREFEDCFDLNGKRVCAPRMVVIPSGSFQMGSSVEKPVHTVTFAKPFALGKFEVTIAQWEACVVGGGCQPIRPESWQPRNRDVAGTRCRKPVGPDWNMIANEYLPWLVRVTGKPYRLPSESEWEFAARAGTTTKFPTGDQLSIEFENYNDEAPGREKTIKALTIDVGSLKPNPFGLHDMLGNGDEWVADIYNWNYNGAPADGSAWTQPTHEQSIVGEMRVVRGGSWAKKADAISPSKREGKWLNQGAAFRIALSNPDEADDESCTSLDAEPPVIIAACTRIIDGPKASSLSSARLASFHKSRAYALMRLQRPDEALADFEAALKGSGDTFLNIQIGNIYLARKDYQKALDAFDGVKSPGFVDAQVLGRAQALEGLGRKEEAIAAYLAYEKAFSETGTVGAGQRQTANEALIRLGARKALPPASAGDGLPAKPCAAEEREFGDMKAKAAEITKSGDAASGCAHLHPLSTAAYKYCVCHHRDNQFELSRCFEKADAPTGELKKTFNCVTP